MMNTRWFGAAACSALAWFSASCTPWTVRPLSQTGGDSGQPAAFDAAHYVDSIWNSRVLPAASGAADFASLLDPANRSAAAVLVKGRARVLRADTASPSGVLLLDAAPYDGRPDAALAVGPDIGGTTLRDALPFIQFSQFVNQLQFAQVGNALNDRAASAAASLALRDLAGRIIVFSGAAQRPADGGLLQIVPVTLAVAPERK